MTGSANGGLAELARPGWRARSSLYRRLPRYALQLITAKPVVYLVNLSEKDYIRKKNKWLAKLAAWVQVGGCDGSVYTCTLQLTSAPSKCARNGTQPAWDWCIAISEVGLCTSVWVIQAAVCMP